MSNFSSSSIAEQIYSISEKYQFYVSVLVMAAGLISNMLIILILIRLRIFRSNQCAFYLIVECFADIGLLLMILSSRILAFIFHKDPINSFIIWCKIRSWTVATLGLISLFTICFATFDQYLSTNFRYSIRQMSTLKLAHRSTIFNIVFAVFNNIPLLILAEIRSTEGCSVYNSIFKKYFAYVYYPVLTSSLPLIVTSSFSLLAYRNVRRIVRRQMPVVRRRLDRQLTAMILARVICLVTLGLPYIIYSLVVLNISIKADDYRGLAILRLTEAIMLSLFYANYSVNFYVFLAISSRFRHQVKYFFTRKCCGNARSHQVMPKTDHRIISVVHLDWNK